MYLDIYMRMTKPKKSDEDFIDAVKNSISIAEALTKLGLAPAGGSYRTFNLRVKKLNIDTSHFLGQGHLKNKTHDWSKKIDLKDLLIANSDKVFNSGYKKRLIKENLLINECDKCKLKDIWRGDPIVLHLDHINGDHFDHRIENLRLLCPNCHSQTPTYCSKNFKINPPKIRDSNYEDQPKEEHLCLKCQEPVKHSESTYCKKCFDDNRKELQTYKTPFKIDWPPIEILKEKLLTMSYSALGKELGISDNAIRKHIKNNDKKEEI